MATVVLVAAGRLGVGRRDGIGTNEYFSRLSLGGECESRRTFGDIDDDSLRANRAAHP